jgi:hypothetical protein
MVCSARIADAQFCSGNVSAIFRAIRQASHQVEFRDCPVCCAPAGPNTCTCVQWATISDHPQQHPLTQPVFEMRFEGQYEGYIRVCRRDSMSSSLAMIPGVAKSLSSAAWSSDQAGGIGDMVRLLIQEGLMKQVPAAMPFSMPTLDPGSFFDPLNSQCLRNPVCAANFSRQKSLQNMSSECSNSFNKRGSDAHRSSSRMPTCDMSNAGESNAPYMALDLAGESMKPLLVPNEAEAYAGQISECLVLTSRQDHDLKQECFWQASSSSVPKLDQKLKVQEDVHLSTMSLPEVSLCGPESDERARAGQEREGSRSECIVPLSARDHVEILARFPQATDGLEIPSSVRPSQNWQQSCQKDLSGLGENPAVSPSIAAAAAAVEEGAASCAWANVNHATGISSIAAPYLTQSGQLYPPLEFAAECSLYAGSVRPGSHISLQQNPTGPRLPESSAFMEQIPFTLQHATAVSDLEIRKAEERARKAHERKLRNRVAALRANKQRSDNYKKLIRDVGVRRDALASLHERQAMLRAENARLRNTARLLFDPWARSSMPTYLSPSHQSDMCVEQDNKYADVA